MKMIDEMIAVIKDSIMDIHHEGVSKLDGAPVGSGRYPLGSGENPLQRPKDFYTRVQKMRKENLEYIDPDTKTKYTGDAAIARILGMQSSDDLRQAFSIARAEMRSEEVAKAKHLRYDCKWSLQAITKEMGYKNDSSIRSMLNEDAERKMDEAKVASEYLKDRVDTLAKNDPQGKGMIDVGTGVDRQLNISQERLKQALLRLQYQGYEVYGGGVPQINNPGKQTNLKVLCSPGTQHKEIYQLDRIHSALQEDQILTEDGTRIRRAFEYPASMDSKRLAIRYAEDGGTKKDGLIELRRGVQDISLGDAHYAQVRILVDGTHYLKGMAAYSDDLPDGVDVLLNTNKKRGTPALGEDKDFTVLKKIKEGPNPFGSLIKEVGGQSYYDDPNGKYTDPLTGKKQSLSLINKRGDEGDWDEWNNKLASQFLGKQNLGLIKNQLNLSIADKVAEFDEIKKLDNPTVKKHFLQSFADDCDASSVKLKAASLPGQHYQVLMPLVDIKDTECYAPNFKHGTKVALVRYPHQGTFEIPILTVNNKNKEGEKLITKNPKDAIGISMKNAEILSGADFDGDTAMVIPITDKVKITNRKPLSDLEGFDAKLTYGGKPEGTYKRMTKHQTQIEMGKSANLLMDMTLKGATDEELAKATKHNLVVIDAEKHGLDWKQSEKDNDIKALKRKYQGHYDEDGSYHEGASTLLSRAKNQQDVVKRQGQPKIDPETGKLIYKESDKARWTDKEGKEHIRTEKSTQMAETDDAKNLMSGPNHEGTVVERLYANYANKMKTMANEARLEYLATGNLEKNSTAAETYKPEVDSLMNQLKAAERNKPRERQAQAIANSKVQAMKEANPDMTKKEIKKAGQMALTEARLQTGARRTTIDISDKEWEAIQAGAIAETTLRKILNHTDTDKIRQLATPRTSTALPKAKIQLIKAYSNSGHSNAEIAEALGISTSTVANVLNPKANN